LGLTPVNRVTAASISRATGKAARRLEKSVFVEEKNLEAEVPMKKVKLYSRAGAIGVVEFDERGNALFTELRRVKTHRQRDKNRKFRWYNEYALPEHLGGRTVIVR